MTGWVKIHRSLTEHELWNAEPFTWGQAWLDLIINTNHAEGSFTVRRQVVKLERGQIGWSEITMVKRWKWSRGKVRRFLKKLENEHMIEQQTGHLTSVITICNYNEFQGDPKEGGTTNDTTDSTAGGTSDEHQTVQQAVHKQECKELKNENNNKKTPLPAEADKQSEDYRFAEWMLSLITIDQPDFKTPNLGSWTNTIRLMREKDKRNHRDMGIVWKWVRNDDFWAANVMSADKFRKQYDRLVAMTARPSKQNIDEQREAEVNEWVNGGQQNFDNYTGGETIDHEPF